MHTNEKGKSMFYKYALSYFLIVLVTAALVSLIVLLTVSRGLRKTELDIWQNRQDLIVNDMQTQYELLESVQYQIRKIAYYNPAYSTPEFNDYTLLENFSTFASYSPLCSDYFMFYHDSDIIYTSRLTTARLPYYICSKAGLDEEESEKLYDKLNSLTEPVMFNLTQDMIILAFPLRFYSHSLSEPVGIVAFLISKSALETHIQKVCGKPPECFEISFNGLPILTVGDFGALAASEKDSNTTASVVKESDGSYMISTKSQSGQFQMCSIVQVGMTKNVMLNNPQMLWLGIIFASVVLILLSMFLSYRNISPWRGLVKRFASDSSFGDNELHSVENMLSYLENNNTNLLQKLKEQLLLAILSSNCSEEILKRGSDFQIQFPYSYYCVFLIDSHEMELMQSKSLSELTEDFTDEDMKLYSVRIPTEEKIVILANIRYPDLHEDIMEYLRALCNTQKEDNVQVFAGQIYTSVYKISMSYQEALSICNITHTYPKTESGEADFNRESQDLVNSLAETVRLRDFHQFDAISRRLSDYVKHYVPSVLYQKYLCYNIITKIAQQGVQAGAEFNQRQISSLLLVENFDIFMHELKLVVQQNFQMVKNEEEKQGELGNEIRLFIENNVSNCDLSLDVLAVHFGFSANYMGQIIKKLFHRTYKDYVTEVRMRKAKELLLTRSDLTVNEISLMVGYRKPSNFIQKFKEYSGLTPLAFREAQ